MPFSSPALPMKFWGMGLSARDFALETKPPLGHTYWEPLKTPRQ